VIAVDTNILARFYCDDPDDPEAAKQRPRARKAMVESPAVFVPLTVILELEWVMRGFYELTVEAFCETVEHLLGMAHVTVEGWEQVKDALELHRKGLDFADALHWASSKGCRQLLTFDERGFARRARRLSVKPAVVAPATST
jgi:predicted nucleic-acid-binding protein